MGAFSRTWQCLRARRAGPAGVMFSRGGLFDVAVALIFVHSLRADVVDDRRFIVFGVACDFEDRHKGRSVFFFYWFIDVC